MGAGCLGLHAAQVCLSQAREIEMVTATVHLTWGRHGYLVIEVAPVTVDSPGIDSL